MLYLFHSVFHNTLSHTDMSICIDYSAQLSDMLLYSDMDCPENMDSLKKKINEFVKSVRSCFFLLNTTQCLKRLNRKNKHPYKKNKHNLSP